MQDWQLRDDGVPIEIAAAISGLNRGAFTMLRAKGAFGEASSDAVPRASLLEVAAARALMEAELAGVVRERALPVITEIACAAYVQLALLELGRRSWDPREITNSPIAELSRKIHTTDGLAELQDRLGVRCRAAKRFVIFTPDGAIFADELPTAGLMGSAEPHIDIWRISYLIRNYVGGVLFHGARPSSNVTG